VRVNETSLERTNGVAPLYRRLPYGPSGMGREDVARNQRARICAAMIESISRHGYQRTTVANVIALAGVSRRSFYELFENKERCFFATHDAVLARVRKRVIEAWQRERGWASRMQAACGALLDDLAMDRNPAHLVLVDSLGVGARARERMQLAQLVFERLLASASRAAPDRAEIPAPVGRAIVGGLRHAASRRMLEGRELELRQLGDQVLDLIDCYRSPYAARLEALGAPTPRQAAVAPAAFLQGAGERALALRSLISLTLDGGYAALSDARIARFAGISTECFHQHFSDKQECYLALLDELAQEALRRASGPFASAACWPEAVDRAMHAFVDYLLAHQGLLRVAFVDLFEVGPAIADRLTRPVDALAELLTSEAPTPERAPLLAREALAGAIWTVISAHATGRRPPLLPGLVDQLTFIVLAPYIGAKAAVGEIQAGRTRLRGA
jgi:AcrR family transcriptional regulator